MNLFKKYGRSISCKDFLKADGVFGCYKEVEITYSPYKRNYYYKQCKI